MILDDAIYVPSQFEERFGCPALGVQLRRDKEWRRQELEANVSYRAGKNPVYLDVNPTEAEVLTDYDALRNSSGVILRIPYGKKVGVLNEARQIAVKRMVDEAKALEADAVIDVKYGSSQVMQGAAEIIAYGTAVRIIKEER